MDTHDIRAGTSDRRGEMLMEVLLGDRPVGDGHPCYVLAEIGINHNGDVQIAQKLIDVAAFAGCEGVKFQKRTVDVVYTPEELAKPRESPFGETNGDLKRALELGQAEYAQIDDYARRKPIAWTASPWDEASVDFIDAFDPPFYKIASASLTDDALLCHIRSKGKPIVLSTGMSTLEQIDHAVEVLGKQDLVLLHCCSSYPSHYTELNLGRFLRFGSAMACRSGTQVTRPASHPPSRRLRSGLASSNATSPLIVRCGDQIRRRRSSRTGSCASSATSGSSRWRWATA